MLHTICIIYLTGVATAFGAACMDDEEYTQKYGKKSGPIPDGDYIGKYSHKRIIVRNGRGREEMSNMWIPLTEDDVDRFYENCYPVSFKQYVNQLKP